MSVAPLRPAPGCERQVGRTIGIDVGGTKVAVAGLEGGDLTSTEARPTDTSSPNALVDQIVASAGAALAADAAGVAVPSVIDAASGTARFSVS